MDEFRNPLIDVPAELHDLMPPYLDLAKNVGRVNAEQVTTLHPLPWPGGDSDWIIEKVLSDFDTAIRRELPKLPDAIIVAMCRQVVGAFADRIEEIWNARSGDTGGRA